MNINYYNPYVRQELFLKHHGIAGQKWGKRNGPPYPLSDGAHSASEKKAGRQNSSSKSTGGISSETKKKIAIGAAVAVGGTIAAVGGYKLYQAGALDGAIEVGKSMVSKASNAKEKLPKSKNKKIKDSVKSLSDTELQNRIKRLQDENTLASLMGATTSVNGISKGKKLLSSVYDGIASKVIVPIGVGVVSYQLKNYADNRIGQDARQEIFRNVNAKKK